MLLSFAQNQFASQKQIYYSESKQSFIMYLNNLKQYIYNKHCVERPGRV